MDITWKEMRDNIRDLGFEEDATLNSSDYRSITINAVNRAVDMIFWNIVQPYHTFFEQYSKVTKTTVEETTNKSTDSDASVTVQIPTVKGTENGLHIGAYDQEKVSIDGAHNGDVADVSSYNVTLSLINRTKAVWSDGTNGDKTFKITKVNQYNWDCPDTPLTKITGNTDDSFLFGADMGLPDAVLYMIPLLASYYVWLDDDVDKALYYYNMYDNERNNIINNTIKGQNGRVVMVGGLDF